LKKIFGPKPGSVRIGSLITREDVPVYVDVNKMVNKHLSILAITGYGKSNTVATIINNIMENRGAILVFDMHSEYVNSEFSNAEVNIIKPKINPLQLRTGEIAKLSNIVGDAYVQYRYLRKAHKYIWKEFNRQGATVDNNQFFDEMTNKLEEYKIEAESSSLKDVSSIVACINKLEDFKDRYKFILDFYSKDAIDLIELGKINVVDFGSMDDNITDIITSHFLRRVLEERKRYTHLQRGLAYPVFSIVEEAHILAPASDTTETKKILGKIGREGRKFGVGVCLVSQRPKALDVDTLSQINNMIVLKIVEPSDQRHIQSASEILSEDMLTHLSSLNVGEAVVFGPMIRIPALVKIDRFSGKLIGTDPDVVSEWQKHGKLKEKIVSEAYDAFGPA